MKHYLFFFLLFLSSVGVYAQDQDYPRDDDFERYTYYLLSDSIFEASDHTYLDRDTVDIYGFIPLTGDDQFIQITNKPFFIVCYDMVADSVFYMYAASVAYRIDEVTGETIAYKGEWNPSVYNINNNKGWENVKNQTFPYLYLWWSMENYRQDPAYSFSGVEPGMYYVRLDKEMMKTGTNPDDAVVSFAKMDDLNPMPKRYKNPRIELYKYTQHTTTSYSSSSSGSGYSRYGSLYNYSAFTMMYDVAHSGRGSSSSSSSSSSTYYTWDHNVIMELENAERFGPFAGLYVEGSISDVYKDKSAIVLYLPNDDTPYGVKLTNNYDSRFDTYWYDLVPFSFNEKNFYCPATKPTERMIMLIDVENKRVCAIPLAYYEKYSMLDDYDMMMVYADFYYVNYEVEGNESSLFLPSKMNELIEAYGKLYEDPDGARQLREYAFCDAGKYYQNVALIIDWLYLNYDDPSHIHGLPPMSADEVNNYIDEYAQYYNDEAGAKELRKYAFGETGVGNVAADVEMEDGSYYTLQGVKANRPGKGRIYIRNGKKVFGED